MNFNYKNFISELSYMNKDEKDILANNIVCELNKISLEYLEDDNWSEIFESKINISLFEHGLIINKGLKDYILVDYLKNNKFLLKSRKISKSLNDFSLFNICINENLDVNIDTDSFGDKILNLLDLNIISYFDKEFANLIFSKYFKEKNKNKIYKLFEYYTAKYCIDLIIFIEKNPCKKDEYEFILDYIFDSYDDFTSTKPKWLID